MIQAHVELANQSASLVLQRAILLYAKDGHPGYASSGEQSEGHSFATIHDVKLIKDRPNVMPGRAITEGELLTLYEGLGKSAKSRGNAWLDASILARTDERLIWWTPPTKRAMFFKASGMGKATFEGSNNCPVPGLVWMTSERGGLYVYAVAESGRPTKETRLYQAPFFNVWSRGLVCEGTAIKPTEDESANTKAWEDFFFGSNFTHPNFSEKDRLIKGVDPVKFWREMVKRPSAKFPVERLVELPLVAGDLIDPLIRSRLEKLPRAQGEF